MKDPASVIRFLIGPNGCDIRPIVACVYRVGHLLFEENTPWSAIRLYRDVYEPVGEQFGKLPATVARHVERLSRLCWDKLVELELVEVLIGRPISTPSYPGEMLCYLAYFCIAEKPYYQATGQAALIF